MPEGDYIFYPSRLSSARAEALLPNDNLISHFRISVAFPSHFFAFPSHFVAFPSHFVAFPSHFFAFFAFLFHPLPAITAYITCSYARFPVSRPSHFSHFSRRTCPAFRGTAAAARKKRRAKNEK
jgi:hypothetical protein